MKIVIALVAIAAALALQTTLASVIIRGTAAPDLVLIVVVYVSLLSGPVVGVVLGSTAGLVQDALSSGIIGIGGLAKTLVGFVAGVLGTQFIVAAPLSRFIAFVALTFLHAAIFIGAYTVLELRHFESPWRGVFIQALVNALLGVIGAQFVEFLPGLRERRKLRRPGRP